MSNVMDWNHPRCVDRNFKAKCKQYTAIISASSKASSNLLGYLLVCLFSFCLNIVKHYRVMYVTLVLLLFYNKPIVIHACGQ